MNWTDEQKANILKHYSSIEEYEYIETKRQAERYLAETDYILIKLFEYTLTGKVSLNDYKEIFNKREEARNVLRNLEKSKEESVEETENSENKTTVEESNVIEETEKEG